MRELARNIELKAKKSNIWEFVIIPALKHLGSKNCIERLGQADDNQVADELTGLLTAITPEFRPLV